MGRMRACSGCSAIVVARRVDIAQRACDNFIVGERRKERKEKDKEMVLVWYMLARVLLSSAKKLVGQGGAHVMQRCCDIWPDTIAPPSSMLH